MIHPDLEIKWVNDQVGYGLFAKRLIPKGTITYIKDDLEIILRPGDSRLRNKLYRNIIEKYSYIDQNGNYILSWDLAKYVNHSCNPNSLTTGYDFEIAIRDIESGEQLTDDYGLFNMNETLECHCGQPNCRGKINKKDFSKMITQWDTKIQEALEYFKQVQQPLLPLMDKKTAEKLEKYFLHHETYQSVITVGRSRIKKTFHLPHNFHT